MTEIEFFDVVDVMETAHATALELSGAQGVVLGISEGESRTQFAVLIGDETYMLDIPDFRRTGERVDPKEIYTSEKNSFRTVPRDNPCSGRSLASPSQENSEDPPDMNMREAANNTDRILDETIGAINPSATWEHGVSFDGDCSDDPRGLPYDAGSVVRRRALTTVESESRRWELLEQVRAHWEEKDYIITGENPNSGSIYASTPAIFASAWVSIRQGKSTSISPHHASECPRFRHQKLAGLYGKPAPLPSVESDYWSH